MEQTEKYTIEFLADALNDITEILSAFVMLGSISGAKRIQNKIRKAAEQVQIFPYSGVTVPDMHMAKAGFRMMIAEKYLMIYKVFEDDKKVIFYHIINGKRNYPVFMQRMYSETNEETPKRGEHK